MTGEESAAIRELSTVIHRQGEVLQAHTIETLQRLATIETKQQASADVVSKLDVKVDGLDDKLDVFHGRLEAGAERFSSHNNRIVNLEHAEIRNKEVTQSRFWDVIKSLGPFIVAIGALAWAAIK